ncbi:MAG: nitrate reductase subunit alpha [Candidatus Melainabacteria bacterium]|nr:nitrate reductase subunit alpha [Candidatus Melainabacteria bacterium]
MSWIKDIVNPQERSWEEFYRNRWAHDKVVRSTHGVNCTGSCSWNIYVKDGIVAWELQALDYPKLGKDIPPYEPRGCQRGISYSWYIYSPLRVKYPYIRGTLLDLWREAKNKFNGDTVLAWKSIQENEELRKKYGQARGKGGFRRFSWNEAYEIIAASNIYTIGKYGSDRIIGFSPIPAMSMISYAAGSRFLQLMGGVSMSFYDWYCDLPPASPEVWGEQTDVAESADWYHSKFIAVVGSNVLMTRTPDAHFLVEARHNGSKVVVFSPDFSQTCKSADEWIPLHQGQDSAFWMSAGHVILKEFFYERKVNYFEEYVKNNTDAPFLVTVEKNSDGKWVPGKLLRASQIEQTKNEENAEWKTFVFDKKSNSIKLPTGTIGYRWQKEKGKWNLKDDIEPLLSFIDNHDRVLQIKLSDFSESTNDKYLLRSIPTKRIETTDGNEEVYVTTIFDLLMAQYGVSRGLEGEYPASHEDELPYTPAWQEKFTGIKANVVINFAREWARTAETSYGKCSVIIGAGVNHWYHNNLIYRAPITVLMLTGCVGVNGGGLNHYVGQEKLAPMSAWAPLAFGTDWGAPPRLQNTPSFHYVHTDQWRYDKPFHEICSVSGKKHPMSYGHTIDKNIQAVRCGWLPFYPQFNKSNLELANEAINQGAKSDEEIVKYIVNKLKNKELKFAIEDPDSPCNFPRVFYIWRGNALMSSAKGHEYFLKHYLGTHTNAIADEISKDDVKEVTWHDKLPLGKMDLIVDLNFRMDTSALYSDIILPTATYYEKNDLNTTDMHTFIHPLQAAVPPSWESKSDWEIFKGITKETSELAGKHFPKPIKDIIVTPIMHDTPGEISQSFVKDWSYGECEAIPGKTMPNIKVVERDLGNLYNKFISLGYGIKNNGLSMHGIQIDVKDIYEDRLKDLPIEKWNGVEYISLKKDIDACNYILAFAAETNGELAYRAFEAESKKTGLDLTHLAKDTRGVRVNFQDIISAPTRILTTPFWSGNINNNRTYSSYVLNVEERIPWRTLTGRQHFYLDHEAYIAFGEHLPTHKPRIDAMTYGDIAKTSNEGSNSIILNYLTPHGKWGIHSTFGDTLRMKTLSRGVEPLWINDKDADLIGVEDNDWVEVFNDNGVVCTRACVSSRLPRGICMIYHSPERTLSVPKSPTYGMKRAGGHNSLTRIRLKPIFMVGGYAQFSYAFNYWGPPGVNRETHVIVKKLKEVKF